jgi:DNA-binding PadR family transcriptional regulator
MLTSTLEYALMGLLDQAPRSGYDLRKDFSSTPLRHYSNSPGSIYPALRRLLDRKWIDASQPDGSRGRQEFRLNERGRKEFISWQKQPVTIDDVIRGSELLMLRFAFMGQILAPADVKAFLESLETNLESYLGTLERFQAEFGGSMPLTGRLAYQQGVDQYRAMLLWAQEARQSVNRAKKWP